MLCVFFFNDTATSEIYTLSLHDALPISDRAILTAAIVASLVVPRVVHPIGDATSVGRDLPLKRTRERHWRSEEHTSELQSQFHLVCRLLLEKKNEDIPVYVNLHIRLHLP